MKTLKVLLLLLLVTSLTALRTIMNQSVVSQFRHCLQVSTADVVHFQDPQHFVDVYHDCKQYLNYQNISDLNYSRIILKNIFELMKQDNANESFKVCQNQTTPMFIAYAALLFLILVVAICGNCLVFVVYAKTRVLRQKITYLFVNSLAVSNLLVAVFVIPIKIIMAFHNHNFCASKCICKIYFTADIFFFSASISNIFSVTIDRYLLITNPFRYKEIATPPRVRYWVALLWVHAGL